ncbi:MAG: hypothetical protein ABR571_04540 [Jatrophihabitans sp.]|uniref:hypothetical protein n=1 Tax=Jatrophihabitans sp. TaxID=1932789 RepID=UPI0039142ACB
MLPDDSGLFDESQFSELPGAYPVPVGDGSESQRDRLGIAAIVVGCIGLVVFGIVLSIVTAVLAGMAGQRAREQRRSLENAYIAFGLAALDGVVWIVLHLVFDLKFAAG